MVGLPAVGLSWIVVFVICEMKISKGIKSSSL